MRLIDADNMRKASKGMFIYQDEFEDDVQHIAFEAYTKEDIENERTVEAITIEWIKKYIAEEGIYPNRELLSVEQADAIERMIENWEKENEID